MKILILLTFVSIVLACASHSVVRYHLADPKTQAKIMKYPIPSQVREEQGHVVDRKNCGFIRTLDVKFVPEQSEDFQKLLSKYMHSNEYLGLMKAPTPENSINPCSRVRIFKNLTDITLQGQDRMNTVYLTEVILGKRNDGHPYLDIVHHMRHTPKKMVRVSDPGVFVGFKKVDELTDEELAQWVIRELEQIAWKG